MMTEFPGNLLILGCGSVAQCSIPMLLKIAPIPPTKITVMDFVDSRAKIKEVLEKGVHYVQKRITIENYKEVLAAHLKQGDILLDLAWNIETRALINWCHDNGICYLNSSVEEWDPYKDARVKHPTELTLYHRHMALREMVRGRNNLKGPTAIVEHGANPGLVSHFTKQALVDICIKIIQDSVPSERRTQIEQAVANENFPRMAMLSGVKTIHISERDTQLTNDPKKVNEFVNTWSVEGLIEEGVAPAELGWGTHEMKVPKGAMFHQQGPRNQICLMQKGVKTWVRSWVPSGDMTGMVIRHGEAFTISDYLTVRSDECVIYRPTVHYAYCPSDSTINSLHELEMRGFVPQPKHRILSDEIIEGTDELGCLLMGHDYQSWWIGSILDIHEARRLFPGQSATTVQVAAGVVSSLIYLMRHPDEGLCTPDELNYKEILDIAKPYLGKFVSEPVNWNPLMNAGAYTDYSQDVPPVEEMWQFTTFLQSPTESEPVPSLAFEL